MAETMLNELHNENCLDTMRRMDSNFLDLTVTSPPYDNLRDYDGTGGIEFHRIANSLYRVTKEGGIVVWVVGDQVLDRGESGTSFEQALYFKGIGFLLHDTMIYKKDFIGGRGSPNRYYQEFEYMFVLSKLIPPITANMIKDRPNVTESRKKVQGQRQEDGSFEDYNYRGHGDFGKRGNVWYIGAGGGKSTKDKIAYQHPAIFPEKLAMDHILSWSNEGDIVYDPFMGSGTTMKMAMMFKRQWIGSEISSRYCDIARTRTAFLRSNASILV